jgi:hypothetical protein
MNEKARIVAGSFLKGVVLLLRQGGEDWRLVRRGVVGRTILCVLFLVYPAKRRLSIPDFPPSFALHAALMNQNHLKQIPAWNAKSLRFALTVIH